GCFLKRFLAGGAPSHGTHAGFVALDQNDAVGVVVAPAPQVDLAVGAVDYTQSDLLFVIADRLFQIGRVDLDVGQVGKELDHCGLSLQQVFSVCAGQVLPL